MDSCPYGMMPDSQLICAECHPSCLTCQRPYEAGACLSCKQTINFVFKNEGEKYG